MFDTLCTAFTDAGIVAPDRVEQLDPGQLTDLIAATNRLEAVLMARRLAAVDALLWHRIAPEHDNPEREYDMVDGLMKTSAEVSALLNISSMAGQFVVHCAQTLADRLPKVAALLAAGRTDWRTVQLIINRTDLVSDDDRWKRVDESLSARLQHWGSWSRRRILTTVDALVAAVDSDAAKERRHRDAQDRSIAIKSGPNGMADVRGTVTVPEATAFDRRLSELAARVCAGDPRTMAQRRADALGALAAGRALECRCGQPDCPAAGADTGGARIVINVVATDDTISGAVDRPGYLQGYGIIDAEQVRELAGRAGRRLILFGPSDPLTYVPTAALDRAVRCRDLTCRFPGCDRAAEHCDIDHTIPFNHADPASGGLTVLENLKCLCRYHHRLKTFDPGWSEVQLPDGAVIWTSPTGRKYVTTPTGAEVFPELTFRRRRTRAQQRASRIAQARNRNHVLRPLNEARRRLHAARKREIDARKFRNHMRDMLFLFKGKPSTSPFCLWINEPYESEELPPDWTPPPPPPQPDEPPF
ncbi:MAG: DUF222 domain-containing protein [Mycobacteriaceae bacterium]|nr:DUF222 domain-containing protein [Mycobacteriaceae bacterium]